MARSAGGRSLNVLSAIRLAVRQFRQHPTFALVTVLVLGLGTGAATTVFTVVDSVVLRPLPYADADRLVTLWDTNPEKGLAHDPISPVNFMDYRALPVFSDAAGWWRPGVNLAEPGKDPMRVNTIEVGGNMFDVLGVKPQVGAGFPAGGPMFVQQRADLRDQRSVVATRYQRRSVDHRQADLVQRHAVHRGRRDGAEVPFPGRRGCVAARAMGLHATQPRGAFHGSGRAAVAGHDVRTGAKRGRCARHPARAGEPAHQQGLELAADPAARRGARLLPAGVDGAVRRGGAAADHRRVERRHAVADARVVARKRDRGARRARCGAAATGHAVDGGEPGALARRRGGRHCRHAGGAAADHRLHAGRDSAARRSGRRHPRARPVPRRRRRDHGDLRAGAGAAVAAHTVHDRSQGRRARQLEGRAAYLLRAGRRRSRDGVRAARQLGAAGAHRQPDDGNADRRECRRCDDYDGAIVAVRRRRAGARRHDRQHLGADRQRARAHPRRDSPAARRHRGRGVELPAVHASAGAIRS